MSLIELITRLQQSGVDLFVKEGELKVKAPKGVLDSETVQQIKLKKQEIIAFITDAKSRPESSGQVIMTGRRPEKIPLSFAQQRLWFITQLAPDDPSYNLPTAIRLKGQLNTELLKTAFVDVVNRHESLRTTIHVENGEPYQVIHDAVLFDYDEIDLTQLQADEQASRIAELSSESALHAFELEHGPLIRVRLIDLGDQTYHLLCNLHHIVSDNESIQVLVSEVAALYNAYYQGNESPLQELSVQYADYSLWQREWLTGDVLENHLEFWRQELHGAPELLRLPTDRPRPELQTTNGSMVRARLDDKLLAASRDYCKANDLTLFMLLASAYQLLLSRYSGQEDICIGTPTAGRNRVEIESLIGFFINTLVLRGDCTGNPSVEAFLQRNKQTIINAFNYQSLPYEMVIEALNVPRNLTHQPLVQVGFSMLTLSHLTQNELRYAFLRLEGVESEIVDQDQVTAKYDMILELVELRDGLNINLEFNTDLFDKKTIEQFVDHFSRLLQQMVSKPQSPLQSLSLAGQDDLCSLLNMEPDQYTQILGLSPMQRDLYLDTLLHEGTCENGLGHTFEIHGELDEERWQHSIQTVTDRYGAFRTRISGCDKSYAEIAYQCVQKQSPIFFEQRDLSNEDLDEAGLRQYARDLILQPYNFESGALVRHYLLKLDSRHFLAVFAAHHMLMDGTAEAEYLRQVCECYEVLGTGGDLSELTFGADNYADYIDYCRHHFDTAQVIEFWQSRLSEVEPLEMTRPADLEKGAKVHESVRLAREEWQSIQARCEQLKTTPPRLFKALYGVLLKQYSGAVSDFVVSEIFGGRPAGHEVSIGCYFEQVPFVFKQSLLKPETELIELVGYVRQFRKELADMHTLSAFEQSQLISKGQLDFRYNYFNFDNSREFLGQKGKITYVSPDVSGLVELIVREVDETAELSLDYFDGEFESNGFIDRLYQLTQKVANGAERLEDLSALTDAEQEKQLQVWNETSADYPAVESVQSLIEAQAAKSPASVAVACGDAELTYRELSERSNQLAHYLKAQDVEPGSRVGICLDAGIDLMVSILGVIKAGAAYVPMDTGYPKERLAFMLKDAACPMLLTQSCMKEKLPTHGGQTLYIDQDWKEIAQQPTSQLEETTTPESLLYVIYTSGSTGTPKGAGVYHRNEVNLLQWYVSEYGLCETDKTLIISSIGFDLTQKNLFALLTCGGKIVFPQMEQYDPQVVSEAIARHEITTINCAPSAFYPLTESDDYLESLNSLRLVLFGGEPIKLNRMSRWIESDYCQSALINMYGPTECTDISSTYRIDDLKLYYSDESKRVIPIGRPNANIKLYVLSADQQLLPTGAVGELCVGGAGVGAGYLNNDDLTAEKFIDNPFDEGRIYRTGDLVRYLEDGNLVFVSRVDFQVKLRGLRVELGEIEHAMNQLDGVSDSHALVDDDRLYGFVQTRDEIEEGWRSRLSDFLPDYMVPGVLVPVKEWPLTPNGKLDRKALLGLASEQLASKVYVAPASEIEEQVAAIWRNVLNLDKVGVNDSFFEVGGNSLLIVKLQRRLQDELQAQISVADLFRHTTVKEISAYIQGDEGNASLELAELRASRRKSGDHTQKLAVIGMAGRFPKAANIEEFWSNLCDGRECISFFTDEELIEAGVPRVLLENPDYVKANAVLEDIDQFDATRFGYSPREAEMIDPQQRIFLECSLAALESSGYRGGDPGCRIGISAGCNMSPYLLNLAANGGQSLATSTSIADLVMHNSPSFMVSRIAYLLDLMGPTINVSTACSTSLVAVHEACQKLMHHEADIMLAGGVMVLVPHIAGYQYIPDSIMSPDGHCKAFDARANGTVFGSGAAVVVLKRLDDAIRDNDEIHAVVLGSATNNDGADKVGFSAPGVKGQAELIAETQELAGVDPSTIGYIEAHGTGTALGDPIEVEALTKAFRRKTDKRQFCALGSVKTNVGHLNEAAGITGFIKTVLAVKHGVVPPSINFENPNPQIDFENSPFFVNAELHQWQTNAPRRAGVSSFGLGGTNAHVIIEEPPQLDKPAVTSSDTPARLLLMSAKGPNGLDQLRNNYGRFFENSPDSCLANAAFTMAVGREYLETRGFTVCSSTREAADILIDTQSEHFLTGRCRHASDVVFMFPGQGAQYAGMSSGLYHAYPQYRKIIDECAEILLPLLGEDIRELILISNPGEESVQKRLAETRLTQPVLFSVEYALATLLMSWGIKPAAMIGHSIGEYVAATVAGVFTLQDALRVVARRGQLVQDLPGGSMLSAPLTEQQAEKYTSELISIAATNSSQLVVFSGPDDEIASLRDRLQSDGIDGRVLQTSHAFHSAMLDPILDDFAGCFKGVTFNAPQMAYLSNVTGTWITEGEAVSVDYWRRHLRQEVRFAEGCSHLLESDHYLFLEVGPGQTLSTFIRQHENGAGCQTMATIRHPKEKRNDERFLLEALGRLWVGGATIDWRAFYQDEKLNRIGLPTYPFQRQRYWLETTPSALGVDPDIRLKKKDPADWFYLPSWERKPLKAGLQKLAGRVVVMADESGLSKLLCEQLRADGISVAEIYACDEFSKQGESLYKINPSDSDQYVRLMDSLSPDPEQPLYLINLWGCQTTDSRSGFDALLFLTQAITLRNPDQKAKILSITSNLFDVERGEAVCPYSALMLGPVRVIPQEFAGIQCALLDLDSHDADISVKASAAINELAHPFIDSVVAVRGRYRWIEKVIPYPLEKASVSESFLKHSLLKDKGVYLITGGLGGMGMALASSLADSYKARLALIEYNDFPARESWQDVLNAESTASDVVECINQLMKFEEHGSQVMIVQADVTDSDSLSTALDKVRSEFGAIDGVIHAAGIAGGGIISLKTSEMVDRVFGPKVAGSQNLVDQLKDDSPGFVLFCSSLNARYGGIGQIDYCAANAFQDALASALDNPEGTRYISVNWEAWLKVGMAARHHAQESVSDELDEMAELGLTPEEGVDIFQRVLTFPQANVMVSTNEWSYRVSMLDELTRKYHQSLEGTAENDEIHERPDLMSPYVAPRNEIEESLIQIWSEGLGVKGIGVLDNFFELGGHSLLATRVITRIREKHGVEVPLKDLLEKPTVDHLAQLMDAMIQFSSEVKLISAEELDDSDDCEVVDL